ncbi:hypothetical protein FKP32DRAFT_615882 [Trametes sanguinea]|nr:hypothetical protein FKP32DRAFT_615882 [Trametes sanguinea]
MSCKSPLRPDLIQWGNWLHITNATTDWAHATFQPSDYTPLTWRNNLLASSCLIPYFTMAYLTRRPGTYALRLCLLPLSILMIVRCTTHYRIEDPTYGWYNWLRGLAAIAAIARIIRFAVVAEGTLKLGEERLQDAQPSSKASVTAEDSRSSRLPPWLSDALEVGLTIRGIGWKFGRGVYVPDVHRPAERSAYLRRTAMSVLRTLFLVDLFDSFLEILPGMSVDGGTIFLPNLPLVLRYLVSTGLHLCTGITVIYGLEMWYDIASLIGVGLFHQPPALWPPMHDIPARIISLHEFWSKGWHQILRDTFLVLGGYPGQWIAGNIGMLFGTLIASGLFHEFGLYLGGAPFDARVLLFFIAQAFGILAEKTYKALTGRRVGGWIGMAWAAIFVLGVGQICTESWIARGAGGRSLVPPPVSIARRMVFPALHRLVRRVLAPSPA